jgi:High potential iron-sulfur protein
MTTRRHFLYLLPAASLALTVTRTTSAQATRLEETDAIAVPLGYKHDASKVDATKYPAYAAGRNCANCQLYQGKAADPWGACAVAGGKLVSGKGWCVVWAKKA